MLDFLRDTLTQPGTFWAAVEALATVGALILLITELPKIKREISAHKVEGVRFAREALQSPEFVTAFEVIRDKWKAGGDDYPADVDDFIVSAFSVLDLVATLIEEGYIDKNLLLYEFGNDLYYLERFTTNFEHRSDTKMPGIRAAFPKAYSLLKDSAHHSRRRTASAFRRQEKYESEMKQSGDGA